MSFLLRHPVLANRICSYFNRDVDCIRTFFRRRFRYESHVYPKFTTVVTDGERDFDLDVEIAASGWDKNRDKELRQFIETVAEDGEDQSGSEVDEEEEQEVPQLVNGDDSRDSPAENAGTTDLLGNLALDEEEKETSEEEEASASESGSGSGSDEEESEEGEEKPKRKPQRPSRRPKREARNVEAIVSSNIGRTAKRQERKYHSRSAANAQTLGKAKGSKAKSDKQRTVRDGQVF